MIVLNAQLHITNNLPLYTNAFHIYIYISYRRSFSFMKFMFIKRIGFSELF